MKSQVKTVLVIAYAFPPHSVVGAMRPLRIAKYLQANSHWTPVILTTNKTFRRVDSSLLKEIPTKDSIYRTHTVEPLNFLEHKIGNPISLRKNKRNHGEPTNHPGEPKGTSYSFFKKAKMVARGLLSTPDPQVFWNLFVIIKGLQVIRKREIDMILVTVPPWSALISGLVLSALTKIRWIADFRDPWTDIKRGEKTKTREKLELLLENKLLVDADGIISSSHTFTDDLKKKHPFIEPDKFYTLYNGFDEAKFRDMEISAFDKFTVVHLGSLYSKREPYAFFRGFSEWLRLCPIHKSTVELIFVGEVDQKTMNVIQRLNLKDVTKITGFISHKKAIQICTSADLLLLAMGTGPLTPRGWLPAKLFEYIACKKPILANVIEGEAADLIRRTKSGYVVSTEKTQDIILIIDDLYRNKFSLNRAVSWKNDICQVKQFEQCYLMRHLASILDDVDSRKHVNQKP